MKQLLLRIALLLAVALPAAFAFAVLVLFFLLFWEKLKPSADEVTAETANTPEKLP